MNGPVLRRAAVLAGIGLAVLSGPGALGAEFTDAERSAIVAKVGELDTAMRAEDWETVIGVVPVKLIDHIASANNLETDVLLDQMLQLTVETMANVDIVEFGMDTNAIQYGTAPDGMPYALIPTETLIDAGAAGKVRVTSMTVGLIDEDKAYLVRVEDAATLGTLHAVYPSFADVVIPAAATESVQ